MFAILVEILCETAEIPSLIIVIRSCRIPQAKGQTIRWWLKIMVQGGKNCSLMLVPCGVHWWLLVPSGNDYHNELERSTIFIGKTHYRWPFSIATLVYQRVTQVSFQHVNDFTDQLQLADPFRTQTLTWPPFEGLPKRPKDMRLWLFAHWEPRVLEKQENK